MRHRAASAYRQSYPGLGQGLAEGPDGKRNSRVFQGAVAAYPNAAYPRVVANAGLSVLVPSSPFRLSMDGSWVSARASSVTNTLDADGRYELRPYFLLGGTLRTVGLRPLADKETVIMIVVRNALNIRIADPGFSGVDYPQMGRSVMLQLAQEW